ncbi:MAG: AAA family ATPase [Duodenibacillus sp.]|nr:AAA family ATPase [Duodenibacillus sp.]
MSHLATQFGRRPISIGAQNFADVRNQNCFYVDKTDFIRQWWLSTSPVTLIARPRRFGKTLKIVFSPMPIPTRKPFLPGLSFGRMPGCSGWQVHSPLSS